MPTSALTLALQLLSRREYTGSELRQKLKLRGFAAEKIDAALIRLQESDLQSDRRFCDAYIRQKQRDFGDFRLRAELEKRGVPECDIAAALAAAALPPEEARAIAVLQKKYPCGVADADKDTAQRFLRSRGFAGGSIRAAFAAISQ